ncbi:hypothetical protein AVEN_264480-1 [Araneus ventricosus]|uniref:Uncharacterized protein n=1 Tax=Araneus ventricosus TaxID=182803 RepID=A0A4Y2M4S3_ARAVE|nr:hypothetical protein AVEN_264480-1 [Araneus ventricosus]
MKRIYEGHPENKDRLVIQNEDHNIYWKKQFCYVPKAFFTSLHNHLLHLTHVMPFCRQFIKPGVHCIGRSSISAAQLAPLFDHLPYSPDLSPSDFHLFFKLKEFLGGKRFGSYEELENAAA